MRTNNVDANILAMKNNIYEGNRVSVYLKATYSFFLISPGMNRTQILLILCKVILIIS